MNVSGEGGCPDRLSLARISFALKSRVEVGCDCDGDELTTTLVVTIELAMVVVTLF
jgi:hypothetical protein